MRKFLSLAIQLIPLLLITGCAARYATPGGPANLTGINDYAIEENFSLAPTATFPAHIAVARVQAPGYRSRTAYGYGHGRYCVVTQRDVELPEHFESLKNLEGVAGLAFVNQMIVPNRVDSPRDLRRAVAALRADMLLIYTIGTSFTVEGKNLGPFSVITLGFIPNHNTEVISTASAALYDVRTGFLYGLAEASASEDKWTTRWSTEEAVDKIRRETERKAFHGLMTQLAEAWPRIVQEHLSAPNGDPAVKSMAGGEPSSAAVSSPTNPMGRSSISKTRPT